MTESERAENLARARNALPWWFIVALVLSLALNVAIVMWAMSRAQTAETSAVDLAQQVQDACATQGSLDLDGRDLCKAADAVVEGSIVAGPAGAPGPQGERGFTGAQGVQGRTGPPGETGPRGPLGPVGEQGTQGVAGLNGDTGSKGADGDDGPVGPMGPPGPVGPAGPMGTTGSAGAKGDTGPRGISIAKVECHTSGDWIITFSDGRAETTPGPCRVITPTPTPPTTTKK